MMACLGLALSQHLTHATDIAMTGYGDDNIDAAQAHYNAQVKRIKASEEKTLHDLGASGLSVDDAERKWERIARERLAREHGMLAEAARAGTMPEEKAKEILEDDYHAVLEAAQLVEAELKEHHIVTADHKMPTPVRSENKHGYMAPTTANATPSLPLSLSSSFSVADEEDDPIDAAQERYEAAVKRIKASEEKTLHDLGNNGMDVDDAERRWEEITTEHLVAERAQLGQAVKAGTMPEGKAKEILEDDYHAVLEAAQLVEAELKEHHIVTADHKMP